MPVVILLMALLVTVMPMHAAYGDVGATENAALVRVGVLKFGTVNWELDVAQRHGLDRRHGIKLDVVPLASKQATVIALQAGDVDAIVTDWIWVSRQRNSGRRFVFIPYSTTLGSLIVPAESPIRSLADLEGKRLGIAGGPLDKSWLILRALATKRHALDLDAAVTKVFGAPPLLTKEIEMGRIDAVVNFWHYAARLEARGMRRLITMDEAVQSLGIEATVPILGYVFDEDWARENASTVGGFSDTIAAAKERLRTSDEEWGAVRPLMRADDEPTFAALKEGYRSGIPGRWGENEHAAAARLFTILAELGGEPLVGSSATLADGTFWSGGR